MKKRDTTDQIGQRFRQISSDIKLYIEKRLELTMLNAGEYVSAWMAASIQRSLGALLLLGGVCFLLVALAIYLGEVLESRSLGYVIVSLPLLLAGFLFVYLKPDRLFNTLQERFEAEVIEAITEDGSSEQKKIISRGSTEIAKEE